MVLVCGWEVRFCDCSAIGRRWLVDTSVRGSMVEAKLVAGSRA